MKKVILHFGSGNLRTGCNPVVAMFSTIGQGPLTQSVGSLPPAIDLAEVLIAWQKLYLLWTQNQTTRIKVLQPHGDQFSEAELRDRTEELAQELNIWLNTAPFKLIDQKLRTELGRKDNIQIILEIKDSQLKRLPWQRWNLLQDYPHAEIALATLEWQDPPRLISKKQAVRVLAVLGQGTDIDTPTDAYSLQQLPHAEVILLQTPSHAELIQHLWDPQGWDILCFAGHSQTIGEQGYLYLNETESLSIPEIKHTLARAIDQGLRVAIFNSCDGFGLAERLAELNLPYVVVMREPVPDQVAKLFLNQFLKSFAQQLPLHLAVREARQRLEEIEKSWPCASLLPTLWQNPSAEPLHWQDLYQPQVSPERQTQRRSLRSLLFYGVLATGLSMGLRMLGVLTGLELFAYDQFVKQRPLEPLAPELLVVEITQTATEQYGYPVSDQALGELVETLEQFKPRAIGLDIHRPNPKQQGPNSLINQFIHTNNVFWVCSAQATDENYGPPKGVSEDKLINQMGFSDLLIDGNAPSFQGNRNDLDIGDQFLDAGLIVRRQMLSYTPRFSQKPSACITPYSLSFQLAYEFLAKSGISPLEVNNHQEWQFGTVVFPPLPKRFGGYQSLDGQSSQILINYRANQPGQRVSMEQVMAGDIELATIRDRVVLIGYTSPVARDFFKTPYGPMPGVWIHGHMTSQLISAVVDDRALIWALPQWREIQWGDTLWVLCWSWVGGILLWRLPIRWRYRWLAFGSEVLGVYSLSFIIFIHAGWMPLVPTILALGLLPCIKAVRTTVQNPISP